MATAIWVSCSAIGLVLLSKTPSGGQELNRYMLGNILWVSNGQIKRLFILSSSVLLFSSFFHKQILCKIVEEDLASLQGISTKKLDFLLMVFLSITVSTLTIIFGGLLVMAFLHLPALAAGKIIRKNIPSSIACTFYISAFSSLFGLFISLHTNTPPTASTSLLLAILYVVAEVYSRWKPR
ncbi:Zinc ABC transporter, inner membrane permease protein ZnuB [Candidatus Similichlamydia laticola]|uniref:Zinc ABC transporter, inner membrane permease protein ZnuB n=2 Tax=Candidatus Similichlamydia laticola TaxID=2170265 RepID=A0A369KCI7_9BACT|nr:Zinc ABC transporter, inner membrane permease protein ZnuB [Candidatus Similichlamydia laticola]